MFCKRPVVIISPEQTILEACRLMREKNIGSLVADEKGKMCGILTDRDVALKVTGEAKDQRQTKVRDVMTRRPVCVPVDKDLHDLTALMHAHHVRRVPIVDGVDKALGIVTLDDLIALLADEISDLGGTISEVAMQGTA
jgi:CBS domain-containing protein